MADRENNAALNNYDQVQAQITGLISTVEAMTPEAQESWIYVVTKLFNLPFALGRGSLASLLDVHIYALGLVSHAQINVADLTEANKFVDCAEKALHQVTTTRRYLDIEMRANSPLWKWMNDTLRDRHGDIFNTFHLQDGSWANACNELLYNYAESQTK